MSLVTLYSDDDVTFMESFPIPSVWVGLHSTKVNYSVEPPRCPYWRGGRDERICSEELHFRCERGPDVSEVKLNWCSARQYCHYHQLGDLISDDKEITTDEDIWIFGNVTDDWKWDDGGCSVFRNWGENPESPDVFLSNQKLLTEDSEIQKHSVCSKGDVRIVVIRNISLTWEQALNYCDTRHSGLLQITTSEDQGAVEKWLKGINQNQTFWIGLRQSRVFGFWIWKDRMVHYSHWVNNTHPEMPLSHNCGVIDPSDGYRWKDHNCLHPLPFICEESIVWLD